MKFQLTELAALSHAAVVVEDRYSQVFKLEYVRPAVVADGIAELQVAFASVPIVFCETRQLAEEWTYRFLAAAYAAADHVSAEPSPAGVSREPSTAEVRAWARGHGLDVPGKGRLRPEVWEAYRRAHP
ncbi:histone-like nucleoid-structuring protein Lsr2 [Nonomuraea sp. NPDC048916]|uniref:Lsr2 family DNA-binding protein n=1 Tax=Nonomuraea sp. NPDC048916 TaxID=3154232 RepID=UPI0033C59315